MNISLFKLEELKSGDKGSRSKKTVGRFKKLTLISGENPYNSRNSSGRTESEELKEKNSAEYKKETDAENIYKKGFAEGEESALKSTKEICDLLKITLEDVKNKTEEIRMKSIEFAVKLSVSIAEKVIAHEISVNRGYLFESIKKSLDNLPKSENIKLLINPSDFERFKACHPVVEGILGDLKEKLVVESSKKVKAGGYILHTESHCIDASIEKQLEIITLKLLEEIPHDSIGK